MEKLPTTYTELKKDYEEIDKKNKYKKGEFKSVIDNEVLREIFKLKADIEGHVFLTELNMKKYDFKETQEYEKLIKKGATEDDIKKAEKEYYEKTINDFYEKARKWSETFSNLRKKCETYVKKHKKLY